jgi:hypothetical protein
MYYGTESEARALNGLEEPLKNQFGCKYDVVHMLN